MSEPEPGQAVVVPLSGRTVRMLSVLADPERGIGSVSDVLATLADHAQQGVYRPGAWERDWLIQAFGDSWLARVEPDYDDTAADGRVIFDRPRQ